MEKMLTSIDAMERMKEAGIYVPDNTSSISIDFKCGEIAKMRYEVLVSNEVLEKIIPIIKE